MPLWAECFFYDSFLREQIENLSYMQWSLWQDRKTHRHYFSWGITLCQKLLVRGSPFISLCHLMSFSQAFLQCGLAVKWSIESSSWACWVSPFLIVQRRKPAKGGACSCCGRPAGWDTSGESSGSALLPLVPNQFCPLAIFGKVRRHFQLL